MKRYDAAKIATSPPTQNTLATRRPITCGWRTTNNANAPTANSHARVGEPKNAHGAAVRVTRSETAMDSAAITVMAAMIAAFRPRAKRSTSRMIVGQKM